MLKLASLLQHEMLANVADRSPTDIPRCLRHVRSAPNNGLKSDVAALRIWAISGLMHCIKMSGNQADRPSRCMMALVIRTQRLPANGNASIRIGPICLSTCSRTSRRARCSRVFTVFALRPRRSAVSSTLIPSMTRVTNTVRKISGSLSIARSTSCLNLKGYGAARARATGQANRPSPDGRISICGQTV